MTPTLGVLFDPGRRWPVMLVGLSGAALSWGFAAGRGGTLASASLAAFGLILGAAAFKWRDDLARWGPAVTLLSVVTVLQGLHLLEHAAQMIQYYLLEWPAGRALGLIAAFNLEWVHFGWNWLIWGLIVFLMAQGMRGGWAWALFAWATLHSLEHTYLLVRYVQVSRELTAFDLGSFPVAQTLPGVLGRDGWLALSGLCGRIPGLSSAPRAAVHFWWNVGEFTLLLLAAPSGLKAWLPHGRHVLLPKERR